MTMCNCVSYNQPKVNQKTKEVVLPNPDWSSKDCGICVDACIVDIIKKIWEHGYITENSCCGHNERKPSIILNDNTTVNEVESIKELIAREDGREFDILQWKLVQV